MRVFKIISIGNSGVGKSAIIRRFTTGEFKNSLASTVGIDCQIGRFSVDGVPIVLQLWDTAGQKR